MHVAGVAGSGQRPRLLRPPPPFTLLFPSLRLVAVDVLRVHDARLAGAVAAASAWLFAAASSSAAAPPAVCWFQ